MFACGMDCLLKDFVTAMTLVEQHVLKDAIEKAGVPLKIASEMRRRKASQRVRIMRTGRVR